MALAYQGTTQVRETKANILVKQYELFKMEEDEIIEAMSNSFQVLMNGLKILHKSYTVADYLNKILRFLPKRWRSKVIAIQEAKNRNTLQLEDLTRAHEWELNEEERENKSKYIALKSIRASGSKVSSLRASQAANFPRSYDGVWAIVLVMPWISTKTTSLCSYSFPVDPFCYDCG